MKKYLLTLIFCIIIFNLSSIDYIDYVISNKFELAEKSLEKSKDTNKDLNQSNYSDKKTPLMAAAFFGNYRMMKLFLENKADPNKQDKNGNSSVLFLLKGYNDTLNLLAKFMEINKKRHANPNLKIEYPRSSFFNDSVFFNYDSWFEIYFYTKGEFTDPINGNENITKFINYVLTPNYINCLKLLLENNADLTLLNKTQFNAITLSTYYGLIPLVKIMFANNPELQNIKYKDKYNLLVLSKVCCSGEMLKFYQDLGLKDDLSINLSVYIGLNDNYYQKKNDMDTTGLKNLDDFSKDKYLFEIPVEVLFFNEIVYFSLPDFFSYTGNNKLILEKDFIIPQEIKNKLTIPISQYTMVKILKLYFNEYKIKNQTKSKQLNSKSEMTYIKYFKDDYLNNAYVYISIWNSIPDKNLSFPMNIIEYEPLFPESNTDKSYLTFLISNDIGIFPTFMSLKFNSENTQKIQDLINKELVKK